MSNRIRVILVALAAFAGLLVAAPSANASGLQGSYALVAPGQNFAAAVSAWDIGTVRCLDNEDTSNYNVGIGFGIRGAPTNPYSSVQGILLRHWAYCWPTTGSVANLISIYTGPGWCLRVTRWVNKYMISTNGWVAVFGVPITTNYFVGPYYYHPPLNYSYGIHAYLC